MADIIQRLFGLSGDVALVTGSSAGIGLALAKGLAAAGARVVVNGRTGKKVEAVVEALRADGADAYAAPFDVTDSAEVRGAVEGIEAEHGPIDVLVNNAGIQRRGALEDYPEATWRELMSANLDSVFFVSQAVARRMIARKRGRIVNRPRHRASRRRLWREARLLRHRADALGEPRPRCASGGVSAFEGHSATRAMRG